MAVAFVITADPLLITDAISACELSVGSRICKNTCMSDSDLELFRVSNPSAASLPLLDCLACKKSGDLVFDFHEEQQVSLSIKI